MRRTTSAFSGCSVANRNRNPDPIDSPMHTADAVSVASITATTSATISSSEYAPLWVGRSERPLPRESSATTRKWRDRYGICIFQIREWTIAHVGSRTIVVGPSPNTS